MACVATIDMAIDGGMTREGVTEEAARFGDRAAWSELIARHNRRVMLSLLAQGILPAHAKEIAQEAWLRLITQADAKKLQRLELPGLAIRQAMFLARSDARKVSNTGTVSLDEVPEGYSNGSGNTESPEAAFFDRERLLKARERLNDFSPSARAIFDQLYGDPHLSHAEVAAQVGLSVQRVRQIICEVRKVLRLELEGASHATTRQR